MKSSHQNIFRKAARAGRRAWRDAVNTLNFKLTRRLPGQFQPYSYTLPDRYPWLFQFVASELAARPDLRILSFGCSRGEEVFSLRRYLPTARIKGIDARPRNIAKAMARARADHIAGGISFEIAATTAHEPSEQYDAIFCLAVLCLGDLTIYNAQRSDPALHFADFSQAVSDLARCLKPGGLLLLHATNYRFCDTPTAAQFDTVLQALPSQLAHDVLFDADNRLLPGERYRDVAFRKHGAPKDPTHADPKDG